MRDGLKIFQLQGSYGYYATTLVGWLRRVRGDEWVLLPGARVLWRERGNRNPNGLDILANRGLGKDYAMGEPREGIEEVHRLLIRRPHIANETVWLKHVPRPADWKDE